MAITTSPINNIFLDTLGKIWALPLTAVGTLYGLLNIPFGAHWTFQYNAISFMNVLGATDEALTLGNSILFAKASGSVANSQQFGAYGDPLVRGGPHEEGHTWQAERLGIFWPFLYSTAGPFANIRNPYEAAANVYARSYYRK